MSLPVVHAPESLPPPLQSLRQLAYVSSAIDNALDDDQLYDIAQICQRRNAEYNLTGLLIYRDGSVFQILEGEEQNIHKVYAIIQNDPRHHQIIKVLDRAILKRDFAYWNFAFRNWSFTNVLQARLNQDEKKHCSEEQLKEFDQMMIHFKNDQSSETEMSRHAAKLIATFQRTIMRYEAHQRKKTSNIWSRPTLSRSNTTS